MPLDGFSALEDEPWIEAVDSWSRCALALGFSALEDEPWIEAMSVTLPLSPDNIVSVLLKTSRGLKRLSYEALLGMLHVSVLLKTSRGLKPLAGAFRWQPAEVSVLLKTSRGLKLLGVVMKVIELDRFQCS